MTSEYEHKTYTIALAENRQADVVYDIRVTGQPKVDQLIEHMESDRWQLVTITADGGWLTLLFSRKRQ